MNNLYPFAVSGIETIPKIIMEVKVVKKERRSLKLVSPRVILKTLNLLYLDKASKIR